MYLKNDHTGEVEQRIAAIHICPCDSCSFFVKRRNVLTNLRQCVYCTYGVFEGNESDIHRTGLCKYKR